jgi:DNA-binding transcriptional ArsR family regulator
MVLGVMEQGNKEKAKKLREEHSHWRKGNFESKKGFFPIFYGFEEYLPKLSPGAVSLFVYIGVHSNNVTGESYHNIETISSYFGKSKRTVSSWFKELQDHGIIERFQIEFNGVSHTFIRPYTNVDEIKENERVTEEDE